MVQRVLLLCGAALLTFGPTVPAAAQVAADSIRARAERDFHGPDGIGKDGPLSAAGLDLLLLYHRYRETQPRDVFQPQQSGMRVSDGRIRVEALASDEVASLRANLERLGMTEIATAGRLVSGTLPIEQIPNAARLETLQGLRVPQGGTGTAPSPSPPVGEPSSSDPAPPAESVEEEAPVDETGGSAILFLVGSGLVLLLVEEL